MSWGAPEFYTQVNYDKYFTTPAGHSGVTFVAASGDSGGIINYPSVSPYVVSVGGTSLRLNTDGSRAWEPAWYGSDGGVSRYVTKPSYQNGLNPYAFRTTPDVSYNASMVFGVAVYSTVPVGGQAGWFELGGTSAGAPQWAGLFAIVNQGRALVGLPSLDGRTQTLPAIYNLPSSAFLDVTAGLSGLYNHAAQPGYDLVTGRGSPYAQFVTQGLVNTNALGGVFQSVGPLQQTVSTPRDGGFSGNANRSGASPRNAGVVRAAVSANVLFIQSLITATSRSSDVLAAIHQRSLPRTPPAPTIVFETPLPATPRFYEATHGYKTASGEEAPYWMDEVDEEERAPAVAPPPARDWAVPPPLLVPERMLPTPVESLPPGSEIIFVPPIVEVQPEEAAESRFGSSASLAAAATLVAGGFAGAHIVRSRRDRQSLVVVPELRPLKPE
jgi:hypothetical protein